MSTFAFAYNITIIPERGGKGTKKEEKKKNRKQGQRLINHVLVRWKKKKSEVCRRELSVQIEHCWCTSSSSSSIKVAGTSSPVH